MATLTYLTGFEHAKAVLGGVGNSFGGVVGTPTVTASSPLTGSADLVCDLGDVFECTHKAATVNVASFKWRPTSFGSGKCALAFVETSGAGIALYYDSADGLLHAIEFTAIGPPLTSTGSATNGAAAISVNNTYQIDVQFVTNGATWTLAWKVNGTDDGSFSVGSKASDAKSFGLCAWSTTATATGTWTYRFDDLGLSATSADYPIGSLVIEGITADQTAAAAHVGPTLTGWGYTDNAFSASSAISATAETASRSRVNSLGDANKGVQNNVASPAGTLNWPLANPVNLGVPQAVAAIASCKESGTGTNNVTFRTTLGANSTNIFSGNPGTTAPWNTFSGTTLGYLLMVMAVAPGGGAWTNQNVQDMTFQMASTDGSPAVRMMGFFYEVAFPGSTDKSITGVRATTSSAVIQLGVPEADVAGVQSTPNNAAVQLGVPGVGVEGAQTTPNTAAIQGGNPSVHGVLGGSVEIDVTGAQATTSQAVIQAGSVSIIPASVDDSITGVQSTPNFATVQAGTLQVDVAGVQATTSSAVVQTGVPEADVAGVRASTSSAAIQAGVVRVDVSGVQTTTSQAVIQAGTLALDVAGGQSTPNTAAILYGSVSTDTDAVNVSVTGVQSTPNAAAVQAGVPQLDVAGAQIAPNTASVQAGAVQIDVTGAQAAATAAVGSGSTGEITRGIQPGYVEIDVAGVLAAATAAISAGYRGGVPGQIIGPNTAAVASVLTGIPKLAIDGKRVGEIDQRAHGPAFVRAGIPVVAVTGEQAHAGGYLVFGARAEASAVVLVGEPQIILVLPTDDVIAGTLVVASADVQAGSVELDVSGSAAVGHAAAQAGVVEADCAVSGAQAAAQADVLAGDLIAGQVLGGVPAAASAAGLDASVEFDIDGAQAAATATAAAGDVETFINVSVTGAQAAATAAGQGGAVTSTRNPTISGTGARAIARMSPYSIVPPTEIVGVQATAFSSTSTGRTCKVVVFTVTAAPQTVLTVTSAVTDTLTVGAAGASAISVSTPAVEALSVTAAITNVLSVSKLDLVC